MKIEVIALVKTEAEIDQAVTQFADINNPTIEEIEKFKAAVEQANITKMTSNIIGVKNAETNEEIWVANEFEF